MICENSKSNMLSENVNNDIPNINTQKHESVNIDDNNSIQRQICKECKADIRFSPIYYLDINTWNHTELCYSCFFKRETRLKEEGKWDKFNEIRDLKSEKSAIKQYLEKFNEVVKWCDENHGKPIEFYNPDGTIFKWDGVENMNDLKQNVIDDILFLNERLTKIDYKLNELSDEDNDK